MTPFSRLLDNPTPGPPEDVQVKARKEFSDYVDRSRFRKREPGAPIDNGTLLVLGVASYSLRDLHLLDEIHKHFPGESKSEIQIEVFDVLECHAQADFAKFLPGITKEVYQTPVLAVWINQELKVIETGEHAVRGILRDYDML